MNKSEIGKAINRAGYGWTAMRKATASRLRAGVFVYWYNMNGTKQTSFISEDEPEQDLEEMFYLMEVEGNIPF